MSEPIRVLNLFTIMNRGGAETMVMNYYRFIDKSKVQFDFLVHRNEKGAYDDEIEKMGGRIYHMCPIFPQNFTRYKKLLKDFFDEHDEYKIIHSHMSELGYFAFKEAQKHGNIIKICHAHNAPDFSTESLKEKAKSVFRNYFKSNIIKYTDKMFVCSYAAGDWLYGKDNRKQFIMLNNAVDSQKFAYNKIEAENLKKELGIENKFVLLNVGRFNTQKNHTFLIDIFNSVLKKNPESVLLLAGNGNLEQEIKEKVTKLSIEKNVLFLGLRDDIDKILEASDVFVFPSLFEGLPVTMVEAQSSGIKCVISDGVPPQCIMTENVEVVPLKKNCEEWADEILKFKDGYERKNQTQAISEKGFDVRANAKMLENFYLEQYKNATEKQ